MARRRKSDANPTAGPPPSSSPPRSSFQANSTLPVVRKSQRQIAKKKLVENNKNIKVQNSKTRSSVLSSSLNHKNSLTTEVQHNNNYEDNNDDDDNDDDNDSWNCEEKTVTMNKFVKDCNDILSDHKTSDESTTINLLENNLKLVDISKKKENSSIEHNSLNINLIKCDKIIINDINSSVPGNSRDSDKIVWSEDNSEVQNVIEETIVCEEMQIDGENDHIVTAVTNDNTIQDEQILLVNEPHFGDEEVVEFTESVEISDYSDNMIRCDNSNFRKKNQDENVIKCSLVNNENNELESRETNNTVSELCSNLETDNVNTHVSVEKSVINSPVNSWEISSTLRQACKLNKSLLVKGSVKTENKQADCNIDEHRVTDDESRTFNSDLAQEENCTDNLNSLIFETYKKKKKSTVFGGKKNFKARTVVNNSTDREIFIEPNETIKNSTIDSQMNDDGLEVHSNLELRVEYNQSLPLNFVTETSTSETIQKSNNDNKTFTDSNKTNFMEALNESTSAISNKGKSYNSSHPMPNEWDNNICNIESKLQSCKINKITDNVEPQKLPNEGIVDVKMDDNYIQSSFNPSANNGSSRSSWSENSTEITRTDDNSKNLSRIKTSSTDDYEREKKATDSHTGSNNIDATGSDGSLSEHSSSGVRRSNRIRSQSLMKQRSRGRGLVIKPGLPEIVKVFSNQECNEKAQSMNMSPINHASPNESSYLLLDNQSETQSDKENNVKVETQHLSELSNFITSSNSNTTLISSAAISDYHTSDNKKPVKVKSRWRRSSELEMGHSTASRLTFGDIATSCSESSSPSLTSINESFTSSHFTSKNVDSIVALKYKENDLLSKDSAMLMPATNNTTPLSVSEPSNIDKTIPSMSSMVIDHEKEKQVEEKRKKYERRADVNMVIDDDDDNDNRIDNNHDTTKKHREDNEKGCTKKLEIENNEEDEKELKERLSQFEYLKENLYLTERYTNKETKRMICDCFLTEEEIERGELGCGEDCLNRLLMIECGPRCTINDRCTNKRFQNCAYAKCQVFKTQKKGFGLRTTADLPAGEFIMEYVGEVVNTRDFRKRAKEYSKDKKRHYYFMALKSDQIIDATIKGNISRFINHSCDPNAETQKWTVNGELRIGFFNRRFIAAGEEITFDYHFQRYGKEAQRCFCESTNCRGWIGDTPDEEKEKTEKKEKRTGTSGTGAAITVASGSCNNLGPSDKNERERDPTIYPKKKRSEVKAKVFFEDEDLEEEIEKLCTGGLKNRNHTLTLSRLMVRSREMVHRIRLLRLIQNGEQPCRRLFLDYHGLRLIWSYMMDIANIDTEEAQLFKLELLKALDTLPIPNKTMLMDSKVYSVVEKWSNQKSNLSNDKPSVSDIKSEEDANPIEVVDKDKESATPPMKTTEEIESNCDSNDNTSVTGNDVDFNRSSEPKKNQETTSDNTNSLNDIELSIHELGSNLLNNWSNLKEVFRIPKKERIEQMKEHEREADDGYRNEDSKEDLKREGGLSSISSYEKHRSDRHYYGSKKDELDRNRERCSGDHHHHHHHHHSHNHTHNHHHHHHHRGERSDKRKSRDSPDQCSDQSTSSHKFKEKRMPNDERSNLVPVPRLTKFERRQLFALKVAKEEEEERLRKQQQELWQQHEARCLALGMNPHTTAAVDPQTGYPLFFNAILGQWQSYPMQEEMCDMYHNRSQPITSDQQVQPSHQSVEIVPAAIPPYTSTVTYPPLQALGHQPTGQQFVEPHAHFPSNIISIPTNDVIPLSIIKESEQTVYVDNSVEPKKYKEKERGEGDDDDDDEDRGGEKRRVKEERVGEDESYFGSSSWRDVEMEVENGIEKREENSYKQEYLEKLGVQKLQERAENIDGDNGRRERIEEMELQQQELSSSLSSQVISLEYLKQTNLATVDLIEQQPELPVLDLPPKWKCAKDTRGRFYYYHVKDRISQWLPPPPIHIDMHNDSSSSSEESSEDDVSVSSSDVEETLEDPPDPEQIDIDDDNIKNDEDFLKKATEKIKTSMKQDSSSDPLNLNVPEVKRKRDGLVQERIISPRRESDQIDHKKYKDLKEKQRKRKERMKIKEHMDKLKKHRRLNKSKSHARHTAIKLQAIAQSNELTAERKIKDTFRINMADVIVKFLNPYRQNECKLGRITNTEDFKYLARKLTHFVMAKELKHCKSIDELHCNENVKHKAKDFVRKYMNKFGPVYQRLSDED